MGDSLQSWWCGSLFALTRSECCATIRLRPAAYPSGLRGRIANPLFVGSNPTAAFTLSSATPSAARCFAAWPRCVPGGARSAASACAAAWALARKRALQTPKCQLFPYCGIHGIFTCIGPLSMPLFPSSEPLSNLTNATERASIRQHHRATTPRGHRAPSSHLHASRGVLRPNHPPRCARL